MTPKPTPPKQPKLNAAEKLLASGYVVMKQEGDKVTLVNPSKYAVIQPLPSVNPTVKHLRKAR